MLLRLISACQFYMLIMCTILSIYQYNIGSGSIVIADSQLHQHPRKSVIVYISYRLHILLHTASGPCGPQCYCMQTVPSVLAQ